MRVIWESYDLDQTVAKSDANYKQLRQFDLLTVADLRRIVQGQKISFSVELSLRQN